MEKIHPFTCCYRKKEPSYDSYCTTTAASCVAYLLFARIGRLPAQYISALFVRLSYAPFATCQNRLGFLC